MLHRTRRKERKLLGVEKARACCWTRSVRIGAPTRPPAGNITTLLLACMSLAVGTWARDQRLVIIGSLLRRSLELSCHMWTELLPEVLRLYASNVLAITDSGRSRYLLDCALATYRTAPSKRQWRSRRGLAIAPGCLVMAFSVEFQTWLAVQTCGCIAAPSSAPHFGAINRRSFLRQLNCNHANRRL